MALPLSLIPDVVPTTYRRVNTPTAEQKPSAVDALASVQPTEEVLVEHVDQPPTEDAPTEEVVVEHVADAPAETVAVETVVDAAEAVAAETVVDAPAEEETVAEVSVNEPTTAMDPEEVVVPLASPRKMESTLTLRQLREECERRSLSASGKKKDLVARILEHEQRSNGA